MTQVDSQGRPEPPVAADEAGTLTGFLDFQRATLAWKCSGIDHEGLTRTLAPSSMTLGGLLKHLALVEEYWFSEVLMNHDLRPPWKGVDFKADPDWEWRTAAEDDVEELHSLWRERVELSRDLVARSLVEGGLDQAARRSWPDGRAPSLRWILCHMIEEYARHNGHADLLREAVDGLTGE